MTLRLLAGFLAVAGLVMHFGLASPTRVRAEAVQRAAAEALRHQQLLRARMNVARGGGPSRESQQVPRERVGTEPQLMSLRRRATLVLASVPISEARVHVRPSKEAGLVDVQVTAAGRFQDLARVAELLVEQDVVLETVTLTSTAQGARLEIAGEGLEVRP